MAPAGRQRGALNVSDETYHNPARTGTRGFGLLETAIAAAIFSSMLVLLIGIWPAYARAIEKSRLQLGGAQLASQEMEASLAQGYYGVRDRSGKLTLDYVVGGRSFATVYDLEVMATDFTPELKSIQVRVRWSEPTGPKEIHYETLVAR